MFFEDFLAELIYLTEYNRLESGPFCGKGKPADAGKKIDMS